MKNNKIIWEILPDGLMKKCFFKQNFKKGEVDLQRPIKSKSGDENLISRGSIYDHFPQGGLA